MKVTFNKRYFACFAFLLAVEILIALFLKNGFIRHTFGDFLVVILMYCFIKSFFNLKTTLVAFGVLLFAYGVEFLQMTSMLEALNFQNNQFAKIVLGTTFHISDLVAYTIGVMFVILVEISIDKKT
ncbi:ribosomal maturation YjgA family protein [Hanstruepera ponticola]|uniref:ribosomal maturation YjgA family protein n=1 Tax=Hanstruepera ponticola TaxID=2042995 RepID=UPI00177C3EC3|nr:DUF2809 domain-containing protein [Hanstruepera ponticola]